MCYNWSMKKFNRSKHKNMGALPGELRQMAGDVDIRGATQEFNVFMTELAIDFHRQLLNGANKNEIRLVAPRKLFGHDVKLDYVASGSMGSVYRMQIGNHAFAFKINRNSSHGELSAMALQKRARNLANPVHIGAVFEFNERKYSWVVSDFIENDHINSFDKAMEKLYFAYITKGLSISDSHPGNFMGGKLIDTPTLSMRKNRVDDIAQLTRLELDIVKKMANCIKRDDMTCFEQLVNRSVSDNPSVIKYMFYAMLYAKPPVSATGHTNSFLEKLSRYERVMRSAWHQIGGRSAGYSAITKKIVSGNNK